MACPGPAVLPLPAVPEVKSERAMEAAAWGTMAHAWKATGRIIGNPDYPRLEGHFANKLVKAIGGPEEQARFREAYWPSSGLHEVAVAVNCVALAVAWHEGGGNDAAWKAQWHDPWATGTLDYVGEVLGDPWIDDLKTGSWPPTPPEDSNQLRLYGLARWRIGSSKPLPDRLVLSITHWPRYPVVGLPKRFWHEITPAEVADFERRLTLRYRLVSRLRGASDEVRRGELVTGEHCSFCPVGSVCPVVNGSGD
jgi:hypothetical protein